MPNWCENIIEIKGSKDLINKFDKQFKTNSVVYNGGTTYAHSENLQEIIKELEDKDREYNIIKTDDSRFKIPFISDTVEKNDYSFNNFIPMSKEDFLSDWYNWSLQNWGTKWDVSEVYVNNIDDKEKNSEISYIFNTAWSPCIPVVEVMSEQYRDLVIKYLYNEPGMQFAGVCEFKDGEMIDLRENNLDNYREFVRDEFEEEFYECADCGSLIYEFELDDSNDICPECNSMNILDYDGRLISINPVRFEHVSIPINPISFI